jgi:hypothetical protein
MGGNMLREILYTVSNDTKSISPSGKQWAGIQYEDNATEIVFEVSSVVSELVASGIAVENIYFKINFNSAASGYDPSLNLDFEKGSEGKLYVRRSISKRNTQFGGDLEVVMEISVLDNEGNATNDIYSYPVLVGFTNQHRDNIMGESVVKNLSELEESMQKLHE